MASQHYASFDWAGVETWLGLPLKLVAFSIPLNGKDYIAPVVCSSPEELKWLVMEPQIAARVDIANVRSPQTRLPVGRPLLFERDHFKACKTRCIVDKDGKGIRICQACFDVQMIPFARAVVVALKKLGYQRITVAQTGGRSVHIIVCDPAAIVLTREERVRVFLYVQDELKAAGQDPKMDENACFVFVHNMRLPGSFNAKACRAGRVLDLGVYENH